jgi:hypothetical protein
MGASLDLVQAMPAAVIVALALLRWGANVVLTLVAGVVAVLTRDEDRGRRALEVLRLVLRTDPGARRRSPRRPRSRAEDASPSE